MIAFDIPRLLAGLARRRPVFHSEADLQHELAWEIRNAYPDLSVRLEYPLARPGTEAIDILARDGESLFALELKYLCGEAETEIAGEHFRLKQQGAQDIRRYDVLKDVMRMEQFVAGQPGATAAVVALTNDPSFRTGPRSDSTCSAAFSLREGRSVSGVLSWAPHTGAGTMRGREKPLELRGTYRMTWAGYAALGGRNGEFRYLYLPVSALA